MKVNIPKVKVKLFASMRQVFQEKEREIELERGTTVRGLLDSLCNTYEQRRRVFDQSGQIRSDVVILKNGRCIDFLDGSETALEEGDEIAIFPLMCGG